MRKTCFEFLRQIGFELGLISDITITSFTDTALRSQLLSYLNAAKQAAVRKVQPQILNVVRPIETVAQYNTGTVSITAGDTTVTGSGTTFTAAMAGRKIRIGSDNNSYEILKFTSTTSIEIDMPYTGETQSAASYTIYENVYAVPPDISQIVDIRRPGSNRLLNQRTLSYIDSRFPDPLMATGEPYDWAVFDILETRDPASGTYAADGGTDTDSIVEATLATATRQNFYKDWYVYNTTRSASSLITAYDAPTTTLTLKKAITGQVATDTFYLKKRELRVKFGPAPLSVYRFLVTGIKECTLFENDADYEIEIDAEYEDGLVYQAMAEYYKPRDQQRFALFESQADSVWQKLIEFDSDMKLANLQFTGGGDFVPRISAFKDRLDYRESY